MVEPLLTPPRLGLSPAEHLVLDYVIRAKIQANDLVGAVQAVEDYLAARDGSIRRGQPTNGHLGAQEAVQRVKTEAPAAPPQARYAESKGSVLRTPFRGDIPDNGTYFEDLKTVAVSERLFDMLIHYGQEHYFTTEQMWRIALGTIPRDDHYKMGCDRYSGGRNRLKRLLAEEGLEIKSSPLGDGTKYSKYWVQPTQED